MEFKYRKDTKAPGNNGVLKLLVDGKVVMIDEELANAGEWKVFRHKFSESGHYVISIVYMKHQIKEETDQLSAEIEYIRVLGTRQAALECHPCKLGWSHAGADRCSQCDAH